MTRNSEATKWLYIGILLFPLLTISSCAFFCSNELDVFLGQFDSMDVGSRASIKRLSEEIRRCPEAKKYSVSWKVALGEQERGWRAVMYERQDKTTGRVGYEYDPDSGFRGDVYIVGDDAVHSVAQGAGALEDFVKYHRSVK